MHKTLLGLSAACLAQAALLTMSATAASAQSAEEKKVADFYRGNTVYMMIGSSAGGGFDFYGRTVGKYMAKYIPGNPTVVPQNLPGAGGFNSASRIAVTAPQDGTYIGGIHPTVIVEPILGDPKKGAKSLKFAFLGNAAANVEACFLRADAPVKSLADAFNSEMVLGASGGASSSREYAALLKNVLGLKVKIVTGYTGNAEVLLAIERGEVQGTCAGYLNVVASKPKWFEEKFMRVISHQGTNPQDMMGAVPAVSVAKTEEQRQILKLYDAQSEFGRPYVTGASVPPERIKALRAAFMSAVNDPELRKEIEARGLELSPSTGEVIEKIVLEMETMPPEIIKKARVALGYE
jgi:tripartite-type tricarboxylate transporter receptor subunit TctC